MRNKCAICGRGFVATKNARYCLVCRKTWPIGKLTFLAELINAGVVDKERLFSIYKVTGRKPKTGFKRCMLCGQVYDKTEHGTDNGICGVCNHVFGKIRTSKFRRSYIHGKLPSKADLAKLYHECWLGLTPIAQSYVPPFIDGKWKDPVTDLRRVSNSAAADRADVLRRSNRLAKQRQEEAKPLPKCRNCGVSSNELNADGICPQCVWNRKPDKEKYFKGIKGLAKLSLEKIASLPSYARERYTKHMTQEEIFDMNCMRNASVKKRPRWERYLEVEAFGDDEAK